MVSGHVRPVDVLADAVAAEMGTGGWRDVINANEVEAVATMFTGTDYIDHSGDMSGKTVVEKVGTTKIGLIVASV